MKASTNKTSVKATLTGDKNSNLPVILGLHGRGSNSTILLVQARRLVHGLRTDFRFLFVEAPFESEAGPGILPIFESCAPFATWTDDKLMYPPVEIIKSTSRAYGGGSGAGEYGHSGVVVPRSEILELVPWDERETLVECLNDVVRDHVRGGWDRVHGVLGFSQGGRLAVGLMLRQLRLQKQQQQNQQQSSDVKHGTTTTSKLLDLTTKFKFGVVIGAPLPPILLLDHGYDNDDNYSDNERTLTKIRDSAEQDYQLLSTMPIVHAWGRRDPWREPCQQMAERCGYRHHSGDYDFETDQDDDNVVRNNDHSNRPDNNRSGSSGKNVFQMDFEGGHHLPLTDVEAGHLCLLIKRAAAVGEEEEEDDD